MQQHRDDLRLAIQVLGEGKPPIGFMERYLVYREIWEATGASAAMPKEMMLACCAESKLEANRIAASQIPPETAAPPEASPSPEPTVEIVEDAPPPIPIGTRVVVSAGGLRQGIVRSWKNATTAIVETPQHPGGEPIPLKSITVSKNQ